MNDFANVAQGMIKSERENTLNLIGQTLEALLLYFQNDKDRVDAIKKFGNALRNNKTTLEAFKEATKS